MFEGCTEGEFTLAFLGYGGESEQGAIELTNDWGVERHELGIQVCRLGVMDPRLVGPAAADASPVRGQVPTWRRPAAAPCAFCAGQGLR